ncbi:MAG: hypothetical protein ACK58T_12960, partial [Phycisphaerae bacterium]
MPPTPEHAPLTPKQIETLTEWIRQGAVYSDHWAFVSPAKEELPSSDRHPVDAFVGRKLQELGLSFVERAPDSTLCRRLYLDV